MRKNYTKPQGERSCGLFNIEWGNRMEQRTVGMAFPSRRLILYLVYAAVFLAPLNGFLFYVPLIPAALFALVRRVRYGRGEWELGPFTKPAALFLAFSFASILFSYDRAFSLMNWIFLPLMYGALYVMILSYVNTRRAQKQLYRCLFYSAIGVVLYGLFQFTHIQTMSDAIAAQDWVDPARFPLLFRRFYSTLENPNLCAGYLLMLMSLIGARGLFERKRERKWTQLAFVGVLILCLLLTYSRGAWVSLAVMAGVLGYLYDRRVWLAFLLIPVVLLVYHGQITERFLSLFSGEDTSTILRFALWESTVAMIEEHPLFGVGWGAYFKAYPEYNFFMGDPEVIIFHAHNMYLSILAEVGIPGGLSYFWFFFAHFFGAVKLYRTAADPFLKSAGLGTALAIVGMAAYGVGDYVLFSRAISITFWTLCAYVVACEKNSEKYRSES